MFLCCTQTPSLPRAFVKMPWSSGGKMEVTQGSNSRAVPTNPRARSSSAPEHTTPTAGAGNASSSLGAELVTHGHQPHHSPQLMRTCSSRFALEYKRPCPPPSVRPSIPSQQRESENAPKNGRTGGLSPRLSLSPSARLRDWPFHTQDTGVSTEGMRTARPRVDAASRGCATRWQDKGIHWV